MRVLRLFLGTTLSLAVACGQPQSRTGDAQDGGPTEEVDAGPLFPAAFPEPPKVVTYGGPVLKDPRFIPVFFSSDNADQVAKMTTFLNDIGTTDYWRQATSEYCYWATADHSQAPQYCVGQAHATPSVTVNASELTAMKSSDGTISDDSIKNWLKAKLETNNSAFPDPDQNSLYVLTFPQNITIALPGGFQGGTSLSCQEFGGYHSDLTVTGRLNNKVAYAVIPRCSTFGNLLGIDALTGTTSHELIEGSSDPYPNLYPAYASVDSGHSYYQILVGGTENSDMCAQNSDAFTMFDEFPFVVQRSWSNVAAMEGRDPCVPALPNTVYFNSAPVLDDVVNFVYGSYRAQFIGVKVARGKSLTIPVNLFSEGDTGGPWSVAAKGVQSNDLQFSWDNDSGSNGDVLQLTITRRANAQFGGVSLFRVVSTLNGVEHEWYGSVGQ